MATFSETPNPELSLGHWIIDGHGWSFQVVIYDTTSIQHNNIILDPGNVQLFEYTNQWNQLVLTGQIVYKDSERNLGKIFRIPHLLATVEWAENVAEKKEKKNENGEDAGDYWVEKPIKREDYFVHMFLINKMEIISHNTETDVTTYRLELISASWYKLSSLCQYSNYNLKKPEPITDIICRLLVDAVGIDSVATDTFTNPPCRTDVSIYYTTTQHDNYFTAINYLLNRMYMEPSSFDVDNHPRIILWDENARKYKLVKLNDDTTCLRVKDNWIQLSRFYEIQQTEINPYQPGFGGAFDIKPTITSFSKLSYTRFIKDFYTRHYWDLNITKDKFVRKIIMNEKIQNTLKSTNVSWYTYSDNYPNPNITSEVDNPELQFLLRDDKTLYLVDECKWNNQRHMYNDFINSLTNRDTFILTRTNRVCHQPWQCFSVIQMKEIMKDKQSVDTDNLTPERVDAESHEEIKEHTLSNKYCDNQFFGSWYTFKTTHSIIINGSSKDNVPQMFERLQMIKPFEITPVPKELRK